MLLRAEDAMCGFTRRPLLAVTVSFSVGFTKGGLLFASPRAGEQRDGLEVAVMARAPELGGDFIVKGHRRLLTAFSILGM